MNKQTIFILGILVILGLIVKAMMDKAKKNKALAQGINTLDDKIGSGQVSGTVSGAINNTSPDANYNPTTNAAEIRNAGCFSWAFCIGGGDEATVIRIVKSLNSAKLARLNNYFSLSYGMDLETFFSKYFWESERQKIYQALSLIR